MGQIFTPNAKLKRLARRSIGEIATTLTTRCVGSSRLVIPMPDAMRAGGLDIIEEQETASRGIDGVVMGIGMALHEETAPDETLGKWINWAALSTVACSGSSGMSRRSNTTWRAIPAVT